MPGIGIISNPFAKINKRDPEHNTLMWYVLGNQGQFEVTNSLSDLARVCEEFKQRGIDLVGIVGGDGTISLTLSALYEAYGPHLLPKVMILRGGTVNVVAGNLGIYGKPNDIMADFIDFYHSKKPLFETKLHTIRANGRLGFIFANGAASKFLSEFYKNKTNSIGAALYLAKVTADGALQGKLGLGFESITQPERMKIFTTPTALWPEPMNSPESYSMVFASTVPKMPFGINLYKDLDTTQPEGQMIAVSMRGPRLVGQAARAFVGKRLKSSEIAQVIFSSAKFEVEKGATYSLDGDILRAEEGKINLEIGPAFVFCSPYGKVL